jgi:hypothetical protein
MGRVSAYGWVILGVLVAILVFAVARGGTHSRSVPDILDWRLTRSPELEAQQEVEEVEQLLEAQNARRRRRGERERRIEDVERDVALAQREQYERRAAHEQEEQEDLELMLQHANERRRRRGLPLLTLEELQAEHES